MGEFLVLSQAVIVFIILIGLFMNSFLKVEEKENSGGNAENGYLPSTSKVDMAHLPKITILYLVIFVAEIIIVMKVFG